MVNQLTVVIHPPQTELKVREVGDGFADLCSSEAFSKAVGVIDTCCITPPTGDTSVLMQASDTLSSLASAGISESVAYKTIVVKVFWCCRFSCARPEKLSLLGVPMIISNC